MRKHLSALALLIFIVTAFGCSRNDNIPQAFSIVDSLNFECTFPLFSQYEDGKYYTPDSFDKTLKFLKMANSLIVLEGRGKVLVSLIAILLLE